MTMGDWLVDKGLDAPRAARPRQPSLNALRRRQGQHFRAAPFGPPHTSMLLGMQQRLGAGKQARTRARPVLCQARCAKVSHHFCGELFQVKDLPYTYSQPQEGVCPAEDDCSVNHQLMLTSRAAAGTRLQTDRRSWLCVLLRAGPP
jgi:hypothetical protein